MLDNFSINNSSRYFKEDLNQFSIFVLIIDEIRGLFYKGQLNIGTVHTFNLQCVGK